MLKIIESQRETCTQKHETSRRKNGILMGQSDINRRFDGEIPP
jgi:hypothetical protein